MLFNGAELKEQVKTLIASSTEEVIILSAFIKTSIIEDLLEMLRNRNVTIYVRWKLLDIHRGVSDFESLYEICVTNGFRLLFNQKLHAKTIIVDKSKAIIGSSNYTQSGLGSGQENIEWNTGIQELKVEEYHRIMSSMSGSDSVTPEIMRNFMKALEALPMVVDFTEFEAPRLELHDTPSSYYSESQKKLPPFEPLTLDCKKIEHREYLHSLGFISTPSKTVLTKAIENSFYGQLVLEKLHQQAPKSDGERRLRWGDLGYTDEAFFNKNDGLHNLFLWLSNINDQYSFYRNPNYPKGTCSLNYHANSG
jgi:hypothetical protein